MPEHTAALGGGGSSAPRKRRDCRAHIGWQREAFGPIALPHDREPSAAPVDVVQVQTSDVLGLTVGSASRRGQPRPVITVGDGERIVRVALDWSDIEHLANAAIKAHLRFAPMWSATNMKT